MSLDNINDSAFQLFLTAKKDKIIKSLNIDNKLMGIPKIDNESQYIKIKAIYLWNNMEEEKQYEYINNVKDLNVTIIYKLSSTVL